MSLKTINVGLRDTPFCINFCYPKRDMVILPDYIIKLLMTVKQMILTANIITLKHKNYP